MKERQNTQARIKKRSNGADNKDHKPVTTVEYPPNPPTFLIELPPKRRSSRPPSSSDAVKVQKTKKEHASNSFYAHSNLSGDLLSQKGSEPTITLAPLQLPSLRPHQPFPLKDFSLGSHNPALSLLLSRRKLWRKNRLNAMLSSIPEQEEDGQSDGRLNKHEKSSVTDTHSPTSVPAEVEDVEKFTDLRGFAQTSSESEPPNFPSMDPCPSLGYDEETDSSSSDEDLDAYEFDLSSCHPSLTGVTDPHIEPTLFKVPKVKRSTVNILIRLGIQSQADSPRFRPAES